MHAPTSTYRWLIAAGFAALAMLAPPRPGAAAEPSLLAQLRAGGLVILVRHAQTEAGTGDPPDFRLDDCRTQRNLSAAGRDQARRLGAWFRAHRIPVAEVRTSQWCRCVDTAELAFAGHVPITAWPALNSRYGERRDAGAATAAALAQLHRPAPGNRVWVSHQSTISALTGQYPAMGEMVVVRPVRAADGSDRLEPLGHLKPF